MCASFKIQLERNYPSFQSPAKKLEKPPEKDKYRNHQSPINELSVLELSNVSSSSNGSTLSYVKVRFSNRISRRALIDTGACANVIDPQLYVDLQKDEDVSIRDVTSAKKWDIVRMASGQEVKVVALIEVQFKLAHKTFT